MTAPAARTVVACGSGELAMFRYGDAGGRPLLAIHGVTSSHLAWQFLADALVPKGYTIYAPDLRGRGDSNRVGGPYGMSTHAADMAALLDAVGVQRTDVIGHSMGGFVAAAFFHAYPHRVQQLVLLDGGVPLAMPPGMTVEQLMPIILGPALQRLSMTFASLAEYRAFTQQNPAWNRGWNDALDRYLEHDLCGPAGAQSPSTAIEAVTRDSEDLWGGNVVETALLELDRDVLFLRAERGLQNDAPLYPLAHIEAAVRMYPRLRLHTVPDTNHYDILMSTYGAQLCAAAIVEQEHTA